jgi:hypothetical protein
MQVDGEGVTAMQAATLCEEAGEGSNAVYRQVYSFFFSFWCVNEGHDEDRSLEILVVSV